MKKKVCMFVWNHFTNDARVLRECTALSENNYTVDLICIHDPKDKNLPQFEAWNENFHVYRVNRYPYLLVLLQSILHQCKMKKWPAIPILLLWITAVYFAPLFTILLTVVLAVLFKFKVTSWWVKGNIFLRMTIRGYFKNYDLYHSNDLNTLPQGYICAKWRIKSKKLIYDSHEVQTSRTGYSSPIYGKMERFFIKRIDAMIAENNTRAQYNEELYGLYPHVVHNYPFKKQPSFNNETVNLHEILGIPKNEKILLYQGGIQTGRGLDKLIKAVPQFNEGILVLIGDGKIKKELQTMVEKMELQDKVKFLPKVPLADLPKYTRNAYLGFQVLNNVCFNHYSASSNKLFEYMMAGVPVVACSFPEIQRVVEGDGTGVTVDSHDPKSIADGVNWLLSHPEQHQQMKANSIVASEKYNWDNEKNIFLNIYDNIGSQSEHTTLEFENTKSTNM